LYAIDGSGVIKIPVESLEVFEIASTWNAAARPVALRAPIGLVEAA
jgi:hypothetical protein